MRRRKRADPAFQTVGEGIEILRPPPRQRQDREHIGKRVLDPVIELAGQRIADRVLFLEEGQPRLILVGLLGQQPRQQHQQARQRQPEQERHHRQRAEHLAIGRLDHQQQLAVGDGHLFLDLLAPRIADRMGHQQVLGAGIAVVEPHAEFVAAGGIDCRIEKFAGAERSVDEADQPPVVLPEGAEHRHVDREGRQIARLLLFQHDPSRGGWAAGQFGLGHGGGAGRIGIHVVAQRPAVAWAGRSEHRHRRDPPGVGDGARVDIGKTGLAGAGAGHEAGQLGRLDHRQPADSLGPRVVHVELERAHEAVEGFRAHVRAAREQRRARAQVGGEAVAAAVERGGDAARIFAHLRALAGAGVALDREDAECGDRGDGEEDHQRDRARIEHQPAPRAAVGRGARGLGGRNEGRAVDRAYPDGTGRPEGLLPKAHICRMVPDQSKRVCMGHLPKRCAMTLATPAKPHRQSRFGAGGKAPPADRDQG